MPRMARVAPADVVFHVLNRGNGRAHIFEADGDYRAFLRILGDTQAVVPMRLLAYCLMPNHWHLVVWPRADGHLAEYLRRVTTRHVRRWHLHRHTVGSGHLYQGPYKSFPIQQDAHFLTVCRYVERNAHRAQLVSCADAWPWSSLWQREHPSAEECRPNLTEWPVARPEGWTAWVNQTETASEVEVIRRAVTRGQPYGEARWQQRIAMGLGLGASLHPRGRPRKTRVGAET